MQVASLVVVTTLVFSPLGNAFQTPVAQAVDGSTGQRQAASNSSGGGTCSITSSDSWSICVTDIVYYIAVGLGSAVAYVGAYVLNISSFLSLNSAAYALDFISNSWTSVRNLANMAFIFILIYIAFTIMLRAETTNTIKTLAWVIAIALIVNFSFLLTRVVIDTGNIIAVQFYNNIPSTTHTDLTGQCQSWAFLCNATSGYKDLTAGIMQAVQVQKLFEPATLKVITNQGGFLQNVIVLSFLYISVGVVFWTLFTVFISVGIKFLVRIVLLWFAIIFSPLALVARTVKKTESYYYLWQDMLIKNAFYPAFFFFIFDILSKITQDVAGNITQNTLNTAASVAGAQNVDIKVLAGDVGTLLIRIFFISVVIYVGMKFADKAGTYGAGLARRATNFSSNAIFGATGFGLRNTLGYAGNRFTKSQVGKSIGANGGAVGRTLLRTANVLGNSSLDLRNVGTARRVLNTAGDVELTGGRGRGGFNASFDARSKRRVAEADLVKLTPAQIQAAEEKAINALPAGKKAELKDAVVKFAAAQKDFQENRSDKEQYNAAKKEYGEKYNKLEIGKILKEAREKAGSNNPEKLANAISTRNRGNPGGFTSTLTFMLSRADTEAAEKIRGAKDEAERLSSYLKGMHDATPTKTPEPKRDDRPKTETEKPLVTPPPLGVDRALPKPTGKEVAPLHQEFSDQQKVDLSRIVRKETRKEGERTTERLEPLINREGAIDVKPHGGVNQVPNHDSRSRNAAQKLDLNTPITRSDDVTDINPSDYTPPSTT